MFSSTTIESSTSMPMQRARAIVDKMFSVNFMTYIMKNVEMSEVGMATRTMREERHSLRKRKQDEGGYRDAEQEVPHGLLERGLDEGRLVGGDRRDMPGGRRADCAASTGLILFVTATTLASLALTTCRPIALLASMRIEPASSG